MRIPATAPNAQLDAMAEDNVFEDHDITLTSSRQREEDWHAPMAMPPTIKRIHATESAAVTKAGELLDSKAKNWSGWSQSMGMLFKLFGVQDYVLGKVVCPDVADDAMSADNWTYNDTFAQLLINSNIANTERIYTSGCSSAHHMWTNLQSMHESKSHLILTTHLRTLMNTIAADDDNIPEHLTKLKHCRDRRCSGRCCQSRNDEPMLATTRVRNQSDIITRPRGTYSPRGISGSYPQSKAHHRR